MSGLVGQDAANQRLSIGIHSQKAHAHPTRSHRALRIEQGRPDHLSFAVKDAQPTGNRQLEAHHRSDWRRVHRRNEHTAFRDVDCVLGNERLDIGVLETKADGDKGGRDGGACGTHERQYLSRSAPLSMWRAELGDKEKGQHPGHVVDSSAMRTLASVAAMVLPVALSLATAGCRSGRPDYHVNVPPNLLDIRPPRTVVFVQTPLRLSSVEAALDRQLPGGSQGSLSLGIVSLSWRLGRQPASVTPTAEGLAIRIPVVGDLQLGGGFLRCQSRGVGGALVIAARPTIESGGDLVLRDIRTTVEPIGQVSCAGLPIPVAEIFSGMLRPLQAAAQGLGQVVRVPLGPALSQGLTELGRPRPLQLAGRKACLDVHPTALVLAPPSAAADAAHTVSVRLGLDVEPRLNLGDCPSGGSPPLQSLTVRQEALGEEFGVQVAVAVPATDLTQLVRPQLVGKRLGSSAQSLLVQGVEVGDASGRVLLRLDVAGIYTGSLFLWGTPQLQTEGGRQILHVPDLQVAAESSSRLQDLKVSLYELIEGNLADKVRPHLRLDVTERLTAVQQSLSGTLRLQGGAWQSVAPVAQAVGVSQVALQTELSQVLPLAVEAKPGVVVAYVLLRGRATLDIH